MKLCMRFSWQGLGRYSSMTGVTKIFTAPPLYVRDAIQQFQWEMRKEYPIFGCIITEAPVVTKASHIPTLWRRLLAKWRGRNIHFGYLNIRNRDVIIVEVTR